MNEHLITQLVLIAAFGIGAQWLAWRLRIPAIVLLLAAGLVSGPLLGWIRPSEDFAQFLNPIVALAVAIILFEGGLNLRLSEYRETSVDVNRLVTVGLLLTWGLGGAAGHYIGGLSWPIALVFGAIIVVTGPTVIMPLLKHAKLRRRPAALLKWESIINDPVGALLAVLVFEFFVASGPTTVLTDIFGSLGWSLAVSVASGAALGYALGLSFLHGHVPEYLKAPVALAAILALYVLLNHVQEEAGLVAVTVAGVVLANQRLRNIDELRRFEEYITVMLVSAVFIVLSADIPLEALQRLEWRSAALLAVIIFLVRPLSVYIATLGTGISWQERLLVAWIAPRGIVAAAMAGLFAPRLMAKGYAGADQLLPLVFALIAGTVVLHGLSVGWLARRLGLASPHPNGLLIVGASPWSIELAQSVRELDIPAIVSDASWHHLSAARMVGLQTHHGQILSEHADASLELHEISHLLAATANDAYNALVCNRFAPDLGRNRVYQLPSLPEDRPDTDALAPTLRGRIAFGEHGHYEDFMRRHYEGWEFHVTQLTETYSYDDLQKEIPGEAILVLLIVNKTKLHLFPLPENTEPKAGDSVISYRPP